MGFIMGGAFGTIVKSLVDDVIMPPIGLALGNVDFSSLMLALSDPKAAGPITVWPRRKAAGAVTINYGLFINSIVSFLIVAFAVLLWCGRRTGSSRRKQPRRRARRIARLPHGHSDRGHPVSPVHLGAAVAGDVQGFASQSTCKNQPLS